MYMNRTEWCDSRSSKGYCFLKPYVFRETDHSKVSFKEACA